MDINDIKKAAEALQSEIAEHKHYDDVQNALLAKAAELKLTWPETRHFSAHVHELKFGGKPKIAAA
jgi:hypothetical protein